MYHFTCIASKSAGKTLFETGDFMTDEGVNPTKNLKEMTDEEIRSRIVQLGFGGDTSRFEAFCEKLRTGLPPGTGVVLRGSVVTAERWEDGAPFDAKGHGSSDLDVTLVGNEVMNYWSEEGFYIPGLHTKPLGDKEPHLAPNLNPLREALQRLVGRPVSFQATNNIILFARDVLFGQPYFTLIKVEENPDREAAQL
jgi:hypothetical protein